MTIAGTAIASSIRCIAGVTTASRQLSGGAGRCCTSANRYSRSSGESWSVDEMRSSTDAETWMSRPCSSHVYQVTLTPASAATSSRRSPGVLRRSASGKPTSAGETRARQLLRNSLSCLFRESIDPLLIGRGRSGAPPSRVGAGYRRSPGHRLAIHAIRAEAPPWLLDGGLNVGEATAHHKTDD